MPALLCLAASASLGFGAPSLDLSQAVVVVRSGELPRAETAAAIVLIEEIERRTGIHLAAASEWPKKETVIVVATHDEASKWAVEIPTRAGVNLPHRTAQLSVQKKDQSGPNVSHAVDRS